MTLATILIPFLTGLTTGGLSCFAVQGGLLTSSIASSNEGKKHGAKQRLFQPILLFLTSKLVVHAILGFLLGLVGSVLSPSPVTRGLLQLAVGVFMVGNALRMLEVHPFFRVFSFEPPKSITRMIRKKAKNGSTKDHTTPVFLGALTVLIPCGVTQVMMAAAISAGSPWTGMAILTAFILGASPTFFGVTYLAARISAMFETSFTRVLAVMILLLGIYSVDTGLNLAGSPYSLTRAVTAMTAGPAVDETNTALPQPLVDGLSAPSNAPVNAGASADELVITVQNNGYSPAVMTAPAGKPLTLKLVTNGVYSCSRAFVIPALNYQKLLQANGEVTVDLPAQQPGSVLRYMCSMGMYNGEIRFE